MEMAIVTLVILGLAAGLVGDWMILVRANRQGTAWFLACLIVPLAGWIFAALAMPRPALPLSLSFGGTLLALVGWSIIHLS